MRAAWALCVVALVANAGAQNVSAPEVGVREWLTTTDRWDPAAPPVEAARADFVVAADGSGTHRDLQAAFDALPKAGRPHVIRIKPGTYRGAFCVRDKVPFELWGDAAQPEAVRIVGGHYAGEAKRAGTDIANPCVPERDASAFGTAGSATLVIASDKVTLVGVTIANDSMESVRDGQHYPPGAGESGGAQGVALLTDGDRIHLEGVHLVGHQDTFYARGSKGVARVYVHRSRIAGDVDFIFGNARLVIDGSEIISRAGRRVPGNGGHVLAPSTAFDEPLGFLVTNTRWLGEAGLKPGSISLARAWDHGVPHGQWVAGRSPNGQAVIRDCILSSHLGAWATSTSRRPYSASGPQANRFFELRNIRTPAAEREALGDQDGWASVEGGTRGGADAPTSAIFDVRSRAGLQRALGANITTPRIVRVFGRINLDADDSGRRLGEADFRVAPFQFAEYLRSFDPAVWGRSKPSGILEDARRASMRRQAEHIVFRVPSNTTLIGVGRDAVLAGGSLFLEQVHNVIIRNLGFTDVLDWFPAWDPLDNTQGEWNSEYDSISLREATRVWIDHCSFGDTEAPDGLAGSAFGRLIQRHDGLLDITRRSNWVTVSWNVFRDHDKTMLIGAGDRAPDDGFLKVTLHHNLWNGVRSRSPRVRWGQVHVYNNLYQVDGAHGYDYSIGIGVGSRILSEHNAWRGPLDLNARRILKTWGGTRFLDRFSNVNGQTTDLVAAEPGTDGHLSTEIGWSPPYRVSVETAAAAEESVTRAAGAGRLSGQ